MDVRVFAGLVLNLVLVVLVVRIAVVTVVVVYQLCTRPAASSAVSARWVKVGTAHILFAIQPTWCVTLWCLRLTARGMRKWSQ